jgi:glycosyltransferase 2 family protein
MHPPAAQSAIPDAGYPRLSPGLSPAKNLLGQVLKFALAGAVVAYLIFHGDIAWEPLRASLGEWRYSVPAFLILAITPLGQFWRWQSLLRSGGLRLPNREVFSYLMVSKFFNMAFPSYVSGDILRGFYVFRRASDDIDAGAEQAGGSFKATPQTVVASIVFDRAAGLLPLFVMCLAGLAGSVWYPLPRRLAFSVGVVAGLGVAGLALFFLLAYWLPRPPEILVELSRRIRCDRLLSHLHEVTHYYVRNLRLIANILGISFATQGAGLISFILFGLALKVQIPLIGYMILVPLGLMVTAIPVTPAGLGVGQVAFLSLFGMLGTSQGANLFTLYSVSCVLINLSGALLYLRSRLPSPLSQSVPHPAKAAEFDKE